MEKKDTSNKKVIIYCCILVAAITILGLMGAYGYAVVVSSKNEEVNVNAASDLKLTYTDCDTSDVSTCANINKDLAPGESVEKIFEVNNTSTRELSFTLYFQELLNTFKSDDLVYKLENITTSEVLVDETPLEYAETTVYNRVAKSDIKIGADTTNKYRLTIKFLNRDRNQNENLNANYMVKISIQKKSFTLNFDANGGTVDITSKVVESGKTYGELPVPTREEYDFVGWFTQRTGGSKVDSETLTDINVQTLYARWVQLVPIIAGLKSNPVDVTDYNSGNTKEMYTFTHPEAEQTTGWSEEERTDYRYIGANPNNYISFNDETWRIIGVFTVEGENGEKEQRIKIIREASIGEFTWDKKSDGTYANEWPTSSLATMLNGDYVNSGGSFTYTRYNPSGTATDLAVQGLNSTAKSQISSVKWYLGGSSIYKNLGGPDFYTFERGTKVYSGRSTNWVANVGLMYPSDYVYTYGNGVDNTCYTNGYGCRENKFSSDPDGFVPGIPSTSWLYNSLSTSHEWFISPIASSSNGIFIWTTAGYVFDFGVSSINASRPCVYLRSDIQITGGDGASAETAYTISVPTN